MISGSWSENVRSWKAQPGELVLTLQYEDCLGAPQSSFRRLATFLRLPVTPEAVDTAIERTSFSALADAERRGGFNERPASTDRFFRSGVAGQWQNHLTSAHINRVPQHCAPEMALHGYTI